MFSDVFNQTSADSPTADTGEGMHRFQFGMTCGQLSKCTDADQFAVQHCAENGDFRQCKFFDGQRVHMFSRSRTLTMPKMRLENEGDVGVLRIPYRKLQPHRRRHQSVDPLHIGAERLQLGNEVAITTVDVVDAVHGCDAVCHETGQHQTCTCADVSRFDRRRTQLIHTLDQCVVAIGLDDSTKRASS